MLCKKLLKWQFFYVFWTNDAMKPPNICFLVPQDFIHEKGTYKFMSVSQSVSLSVRQFGVFRENRSLDFSDFMLKVVGLKYEGMSVFVFLKKILIPGLGGINPQKWQKISFFVHNF